MSEHNKNDDNHSGEIWARVSHRGHLVGQVLKDERLALHLTTPYLMTEALESNIRLVSPLSGFSPLGVVVFLSGIVVFLSGKGAALQPRAGIYAFPAIRLGALLPRRGNFASVIL
jgi:hypothetical protein